jgi:hypothetical protein
MDWPTDRRSYHENQSIESEELVQLRDYSLPEYDLGSRRIELSRVSGLAFVEIRF